jgi:hypothetical protein
MANDVLRRPLFALGKIVLTPGALRALAMSGDDPVMYLARHRCGDWGELDDEDWKTNNTELTHAGRLLSAYKLSNNERIWIITEATRERTTLLLPDEY